MHHRFFAWNNADWLRIPLAVLMVFFAATIYYLLAGQIVTAVIVAGMGTMYFSLMRYLTDQIVYSISPAGLILEKLGRRTIVPLTEITHVENYANASLDKPHENWGFAGAHFFKKGLLVHTKDNGYLVSPHPPSEFVTSLQDTAQNTHGQLISFHA